LTRVLILFPYAVCCIVRRDNRGISKFGIRPITVSVRVSREIICCMLSWCLL